MAEYFPTPLEISTAAADALSGTTDTRTAIAYLPAGARRTSSPTLAQRVYRIHRHMLRTLAGTRAGMAVKTGTLQIGAYPLRYRKADGTAAYFEGGLLSLTASNTNYVYIDHATNLLAKSTTGWPADITTFTALAEYVCDGSDITTEDDAADRRGLNLFQTNSSSTSPTGTTATAFTLDSDNAGAGVDQQLRANRGTDDAEDAALEWDESDDRWNVLEQHSSGTLCPLNAGSIQVTGATVIGADGDIEAASIATDQLYVVGANGTTPVGLRLTAMAGSGAPGAGTHAVGELALDVSGVLFVCVAAGTPGTWQKVGEQDDVIVWSIGNGSAAAGGAASCTIQAQDQFGNAVAAAMIVDVYLMDDTDGAADAPNCSTFTVTTGTNVRTLTANKSYRCKTDANGTLVFTVVNSIADQVYVLLAAPPGARTFTCDDRGVLTYT